MPRRPLAALAVLWTIAFLLRGSPADALCVGPTTPCREFDRTPVIFQGVVERITPIDEYSEPLLGPIPSRLARVRVERVWKGLDKATTVDLVTLGQPGKNWVEDEIDLKVGEHYIIWAYPSSMPDVLHASGCSLTQPLKDAADQVEYLDSRSQAAVGGYVYGTVGFHERSVAMSITPEGPTGAIVVLDGQGVHREARVDASGRFRFAGLPVGTFDVRLILQPNQAAGRTEAADPHAPERESRLQSTAVIKNPRDCEQIGFWIQSNGHLSGFLAAAEGQSPGGIVVEAVLVDHLAKVDDARVEGKPGYLLSAKAITKPDGYFEMDNLPPGRFVVGVTLDQKPSADSPFPRTFYPGVPSLDEATIVELQRGQQQSIGSMKLPPRLAAVSVPGMVTDVEGRPAADVFIAAYNNWRTVATSTRTDKDGKFVLSLYAGYTYSLRATLYARSGELLEQRTSEIGAPEAVETPLRLVLRAPIPK